MKKIFTKGNIKNWIAAVTSLIISVCVFFYLPDMIPTHFNGAGKVDGYGSRYTIFLFPGFMFLFIFCAEIFRNVDPKKENYKKFEKFYYYFFFLMNMVLLASELAVISCTFGFDNINISSIIIAAIGILFAFLGNMMPKIKQNYYMGFKTSWALADSNNWYKTHRLAGKVWTIGGIIIVLMSFILKSEMLIWTMPAVVLVMCLIPSAGSYIYYIRYNKY